MRERKSNPESQPMDAEALYRERPELRAMLDRWKAEIGAINENERQEFSSWLIEHRRWTRFDGSGSTDGSGGDGGCGGD